MESRYVHKAHNVSVLMYHVVCAGKYRRVVKSPKVDEVLRQACMEIEKRWELRFLEIGFDRDHAHFLIQRVPSYSPSRMVQIVKSVIAREVFEEAPAKAVGGAFWGEGYFMNTVGQHGSEKVISAYVANQGGKSDYRVLHKGQMELGLD